MSTAQSKDGTTIAYDKLGSGPAIILVCGGSVDRQSNGPLTEELSRDFTVYNYDRRGRGDSGDTLPFALDREIEDIDPQLAFGDGPASTPSPPDDPDADDGDGIETHGDTPHPGQHAPQEPTHEDAHDDEKMRDDTPEPAA